MAETRSIATHYYDPQADITAYELALILPLGIAERKAVLLKDTTWDELPDNVKRHFKDTKYIK
jgi:hypothetical protein